MYKRRLSARTKRLLRGLAKTRQLLWAIGDAAAMAGAVAVSGRARCALASGGLEALSAVCDEMQETEIRRSFRDLRRRRYLTIRRRGGRLEAVLTEKGLLAAMTEQIRVAERSPKGTYCVVTFDFPEKARKHRDRFRRLLVDLGFEMLHFSVWVTDYDAHTPLLRLLNLMGLGEWVRVFEAKLISGPKP